MTEAGALIGLTERQWRSRMMRLCFTMMPGGVLLMGLGAYLAVGPGGMTGYVVGSVGVTLFVMGALFGKFSVWGPVPDKVRGVQ